MKRVFCSLVCHYVVCVDFDDFDDWWRESVRLLYDVLVYGRHDLHAGAPDGLVEPCDHGGRYTQRVSDVPVLLDWSTQLLFLANGSFLGPSATDMCVLLC